MKNAVSDEELLERLDVSSAPPEVTHGTYSRHMDSIEETGLSRQRRKHIHFVVGPDAVSGRRADADVLLHLNVAKAMEDGLVLFRSANGVVLTPGFDDEGVVPFSYFRVERLTKRSKQG